MNKSEGQLLEEITKNIPEIPFELLVRARLPIIEIRTGMERLCSKGDYCIYCTIDCPYEVLN